MINWTVDNQNYYVRLFRPIRPIQTLSADPSRDPILKSIISNDKPSCKILELQYKRIWTKFTLKKESTAPRKKKYR